MNARSTATRRLLRVPEITAIFWIIKGLSTAMGESTSDYLVHAVGPVPAVLLGFSFFLIALALQFSRRRYLAWSYWFAVAMVGVFGTMAADVLHVGFGVPYIASSALYGLALAVIFVTWQRSQKHALDPQHRQVLARGLLLGHGGGHLRPGHRGRRHDGGDLAPRVLPVGHALRRGDLRPRHRLLALPLERGLRLLVCLRHHASAGRLVCRLDGQAHQQRRSGLGRGTGRPGLRAAHRRLRRLSDDHSQGCSERSGVVDPRDTAPGAGPGEPRWLVAPMASPCASSSGSPSSVAATAVAFFVGYLIGPHFVAHVF